VTRAQRGFTLLELLIALALVATLLVIAFGGLRVALASWRRGEDRAEAQQHVRGVALALARTIGASYPYRGDRGVAPESALLFFGTETRLELVTQSPPFPFPAPIAFTAVVMALGESEERSGLVVRQRPLPNRNPFVDAVQVFHDPSVTSLAFQYLDAGGSWVDEWDGGRDNVLPRAVRVTVGTTLNGQAQTLPPLTVSLRLGETTGQ
jgi:general secretion pathway protein J